MYRYVPVHFSPIQSKCHSRNKTKTTSATIYISATYKTTQMIILGKNLFRAANASRKFRSFWRSTPEWCTYHLIFKADNLADPILAGAQFNF
jgi:hypothetical protein